MSCHKEAGMKIFWQGHACFLFELAGTKIITDPYEPGSYNGAVGYEAVNIDADIVTVSHAHADHNYTAPFKNAKVISTPAKVNFKGIEIEGILSFHDKSRGKERGKNIIFVFSGEGIKIAHLGDLGTTDIDYARLGEIDILLVPVGGVFTLDAKEADILIEKTNPKIVIPMHYKTPKINFPIAGVETFLQGKKNIKSNLDFLEITKQTLPLSQTICVFNYQR